MIINTYFYLIFSILVTSNVVFAKFVVKTNFKIKSHTSVFYQVKAVQELIGRLFPSRKNDFNIVINSSLIENDKDVFTIQTFVDQVLIEGTNGVAAANGLNYFLKYFAKCHFAWSGQQLSLPSPLPKVLKKVKIVIEDKFRYYQNVCTQSYSMVWWNWTRWEKEIDWMALNGINMPLVTLGQEYIWKKAFKRFGINATDADNYFTGPAFLSWNRMGNIFGWAGPLNDDWHLDQKILAKNVIKRMRSFGMVTILPAFAGNIPSQFSKLFPKAKINNHPSWSHFNCSYSCVSFLDPRDPLFKKISNAIIKEYILEFGTDHLYNADLFNEMRPKTSDLDYLRSVARATYQSLVDADTNAIWIIQGWMFGFDQIYWKRPQVKAFLELIPKGRLILLDLQSELAPQFSRFDGYFGHDFIWCMLQNYGGVLGLYGSFDNINQELFKSRNSYNSMIGIGLTPEGIEQNEIMYDFMTETIWHTDQLNLTLWLKNYSERRYGLFDYRILHALLLLKKEVYNVKNIFFKNHGQYMLIKMPSLKFSEKIWYNRNDVFDSWQLYINVSKKYDFNQSVTFKYDLTDLSRQSLQLLFSIQYLKVIDAYSSKNISKLYYESEKLIEILEDLEMLLASDSHFLLGTWLESAKAMGKNDEQKKLYEFNARNQITLWGPNGEIRDYANKQWSGLIADFYKKRWKLFVKYIQTCLKEKKPFKKKVFSNMVLYQIEYPFVNDTKIYPTQSQGDTLAINQKLFLKYKTSLNYEF